MDPEELNELDERELDELLQNTLEEKQVKKPAKDFEAIEWQAYEYEHTKKDPSWFWALGIVTIGLIAIAYIMDNILFGIMVAIGAFAVALFAARTPDKVTFKITDRGVLAHTHLYPYTELRSFHVLVNDNTARLLLRSKRSVMPVISIPIPPERADDIRSSLLHHLKEEELHDPAARILFDRLGF